jgi:hypothetical protein
MASEDGMASECVVSLDNLRTVPKAQLVEAITELGTERMDQVSKDPWTDADPEPGDFDAERVRDA